MKFCEKLQKLRKEKGYSQEQLADLLEVSRQSVSKWESGTTYPEMDKLLILCKIFNVSLDDLTNDDISSNKIMEKSKNNFSNLVYTILDMITSSIEMFKNMSGKERIKCFSELIILFLILLVFRIPFEIINESIRNIFINFGGAFNILNSIWLFISNVIYLVLFIAIFTYIYKVRYLDKSDKYIKKDIENEDIEKEDNDIESKNIKENIPIKKERHNFIIFDILGAIFNVFIKICIFFIVIPVIFVFVMFVVLTVISLIVEFLNIHYISFFIGFLGCSIISFVIMEIMLRLLFNSRISFKRHFITFIVGIVISSIGVGVGVYEIASTKYIDSLPEDIKITSEQIVYKMDKDLVIDEHSNIKYEIDETLKEDLIVELKYYDEVYNLSSNIRNNVLYINYYSGWSDIANMWKYLKKDLQNKKIHNYDLLYNEIKITIKSSSENINILKENYKKYQNMLREESNKYNRYYEEIERLTEKLNEQENMNYELEQKNKMLEEKLKSIEEQLTY